MFSRFSSRPNGGVPYSRATAVSTLDDLRFMFLFAFSVPRVDFGQHFGVLWNQNGAKSEPKGDQNAQTNQDRKKVSAGL